jgi:hypothetical protein
MRRAGVVAASLAACLGALLVARAALATCTDPVSDKNLTSKSLGAISLSPAGIHPTLGITVVPSKSTINILSTKDLGIVKTVSLDGDVQNSPVPVLTGEGTYAAFVGTSAGSVYRIALPAGTIVWQRTLRRSGCTGDGISASPVVHLRQYASDDFKARYVTDLVYVATHYQSTTGCLTGHNTDNRVYALQATDGLPVWTFNESGADDVDYFSQAGFLDATHDKLYMGSERNFSATQSTLWALDVLTGTRAWAANVGALETMPMVVDDRVYVGAYSGQVKAVSRLDGAAIWSLPTGATRLTNNILVERRPPYQKMIFAVGNNNGYVYAIRDDNTAGVKVWGKLPKDGSGSSPPTSVLAKTRAAIDSEAGKLYVGTAQGFISQMDLATGDTDIYRTAGTTAQTIGDPSFAFEDTDGNGTFDDVRLFVGNSGGMFSKFCSPWASSLTMQTGGQRNRACTSDTDCGTTGNTTCKKAKCINRVCTTLPTNEGGSCNTGVTYTNPGTCTSGTCQGRSDCEKNFANCTCQESDGSTYTRAFDYGNGNETALKMSNGCVTIGTNVRTAAVLHIVDDKGRPVTGASVEMYFDGSGGAYPLWVNPNTDVPLPASTTTISTSNYVVSSARPGTYFGILTAKAAGQANTGVPIHANIALPGCAKGPFQTTLRIAAPGTGGGAFNGGCNLLNEKNESRNLRVQVVREDNGQPLKEAVVMVGYRSDAKKFQSRYENFITSGGGDKPNVQTTDGNGYAEFNDLGDNLNGPFVVTAGKRPDGDEYATVTIQSIASTDIRMALPVVTAVAPARLEKGKVVNTTIGSDSANTRLAFVAQKRKLDFFANVDPARLMDMNECTLSSGLLVPENAYVARAPTTIDKYYAKNFTPMAHDHLQTSYHYVPTAKVWPTAGEGMDLVQWVLDAKYEQLGFYFNIDLQAGTNTGPKIPLSTTAAAKYMLEIRSSPDQYWDVMGTTLTDYSSDNSAGRGAGDLFLQGHASVAVGNGTGIVTVPFFNLDDANLDNNGYNIANSTTWNLAQLTGMYLMNPACGQSGQDSRCNVAEITPAMRSGRSSVIKRVVAGTTCSEPWVGTETNTVYLSGMGTYPKVLDLLYSGAGGGFYRTCPAARYRADGLCCIGEWANGNCYKGNLPGDYQRHTISVKRTTYHKPGACATEWQTSVTRTPRWVYFTPGDAAMIFAPDLAADFPNACGGVDTSACLTDQRMGLPQRMGSGQDCSLGCKSGETCTDVTGKKQCAVYNSADGSYSFEDYEWQVDHEAVDLVGNSCQTTTPCSPSSKPVLDTTLDFPRFDGVYDFNETPSCLTARSSNDMIVN